MLTLKERSVKFTGAILVHPSERIAKVSRTFLIYQRVLYRS